MAETEVGAVTHFFTHISVATIKLTGPVRVGETLVIKGAHDDVRFSLDSMQIEHANVSEAKSGQEVGVKVPGRVHEGSRVYVERA